MKALTSNYASASFTDVNLVPDATAYAAGSYTLNGLTAGVDYRWIKGANDTSMTNGAVTISASGVFTASGTSITLTGSGTSAITAIVCPLIQLYPSTFTPSLPAKQMTVPEYTQNANFIRLHQANEQAHTIKYAAFGVAIPLADLTNLAFAIETGLTWTPPIIKTQPEAAACVHSSTTATFTLVAASEYILTYSWFEQSPLTKTAATLTWAAAVVAEDGITLTSNNTNVSDGDTVTIGEKVYTFKTALTPTEGEVLIGADADGSLLNLARAINHTGTPDTDYKCAAANTTVSSSGSVTSHAITITPKALTTAGIYDVSTAGTLVVTPTDTMLNGAYYYCTVTDDAGSYGLTNGSKTSYPAELTVT